METWFLRLRDCIGWRPVPRGKISRRWKGGGMGCTHQRYLKLGNGGGISGKWGLGVLLEGGYQGEIPKRGAVLLLGKWGRGAAVLLLHWGRGVWGRGVVLMGAEMWGRGVMVPSSMRLQQRVWHWLNRSVKQGLDCKSGLSRRCFWQHASKSEVVPVWSRARAAAMSFTSSLHLYEVKGASKVFRVALCTYLSSWARILASFSAFLSISAAWCIALSSCWVQKRALASGKVRNHPPGGGWRRWCLT